MRNSNFAEGRVVITGLGAITPLGLTVEDYWHGLIEGKNGVGPLTIFDPALFPIKIAAQVKGFEPTNYMDIKRVDRSAPCAHFGIAATRMAFFAY
jgi:3-oxoacyl-[acyl-carrier-protein] synthase II